MTWELKKKKVYPSGKSAISISVDEVNFTRSYSKLYITAVTKSLDDRLNYKTSFVSPSLNSMKSTETLKILYKCMLS